MIIFSACPHLGHFNVLISLICVKSDFAMLRFSAGQYHGQRKLSFPIAKTEPPPYSRLYRAGVFVFVVPQPIQDLSAVSITAKCRSKFLRRWTINPLNFGESLSNTLRG
jgi:hypothetical protein